MANFSLNIGGWVNKANGNMDKVVRKTLITLFSRIIKRNPVGDGDYWVSPPPPGYVGGHSRANWQYGNNIRPGGIVMGADKGGDVTIAAMVGKVTTTPVGSVHWFANNVEYAQRLEDGWSKRQAPNGMVKITAMEFGDIVRVSGNDVN